MEGANSEPCSDNATIFGAASGPIRGIVAAPHSGDAQLSYLI